MVDCRTLPYNSTTYILIYEFLCFQRYMTHISIIKTATGPSICSWAKPKTRILATIFSAVLSRFTSFHHTNANEYQTKLCTMLYENVLTLIHYHMKICNLRVEHGQNACWRRPYWKMAAIATLLPAANYRYWKSWSTNSYDSNNISHCIALSKLPRDYICPRTIILPTYKTSQRKPHNLAAILINC